MSEPIRIAMVSEHASPLAALGGADAGGQNVHVAALARELATQGASVVVHTRRDDPSLPRQVQLGAGVTVDHVDAGPAQPLPKDSLLPHMPSFAADLAAQWRSRPPDVVHAHFWMSAHAALIAAREVGVPVIQTFHALGAVKRRYQGEKDTSPPERLAIERRIMRNVEHIVATCTDEVFELLRLGANRGRLTVIPCGVDLEMFSPDGERARRRGGMNRIVCIGRLVERKGIGNAISALPQLPGTELVIAGGPPRDQLDDDPEARRLCRLAREVGVADRVQLRGRVGRSEVAALLRSADAAVCVPWYEPFGIVPLEAMACGVPVVASAVGGMIDTVVDGVTGVHVPPRDPDRLAEALAGLLADPRRRASYGSAGVRRARGRYGWSRIAAATSEVYTRVAGGRSPTRTPRRRRERGRIAPSDGRRHCEALADALRGLRQDVEQIEAWGRQLAEILADGGRLLVVGNGGSAAQAQHLTAELVGRYRTERRPLSAICLHGDTSSLTAIANDYGAEEAFARQVHAHGRRGDVLIALSTSGRSANVLRAVETARQAEMTTWAMTGGCANPIAEACDEALHLGDDDSATTQELHLVCLHVLCDAVDREIALREAALRMRADRGTALRTPEPGGLTRPRTQGPGSLTRPRTQGPSGRPRPRTQAAGGPPRKANGPRYARQASRVAPAGGHPKGASR